MIQNLFKSENIKTELVEYEGRILSPFNVAIYKGALNQRVGGYLIPNSLSSITEQESIELASKIPKAALIIVEIGEIPLKSVIAFLKVAKTKGALIFMDVDLDPIKQMGATVELFEEAARLSDILIPNYEAVRDVYGIEDREELCMHLHKKTNTTVIITDGSEDIFFFEKTMGPGVVEVNKISDPIDTVGAGDSFHGSLMYFLGQGQLIKKAIKNASICAGIACNGFGARTSMPYASDVRHIIQDALK